MSGEAEARLSRRQLLLGGSALGGLALFGAAGCGSTGARPFAGTRRLGAFASRSHAPRSDARVKTFLTRADFRPPRVAATGGTGSAGYLCLGPGSNDGFKTPANQIQAQQGPLLADDGGDPIWFRPLPGTLWATNTRVQTYRGRPVLTWWEGQVITKTGFGQGEGVILDTSYREIARVRAGNGRQADLHEFVLTPQGTALITCYPETATVDLSSIGGPVDGRVLRSMIQEVDVATGRVLLEWDSLDHVSVDESYEPYNEPYDFLHINSIDVLPDGNLLLSARATWALYKLDRHSGEVMWRLAGKRSNFALGRSVRFSWQHHATYIGDGKISLFDDRAGPVNTGAQSRALILRVDSTRRTADLETVYAPPKRLLATSMGSVQILPNDNVLVGWGNQRYTSEFDPHGNMLLDADIPGGLFSYRSFRCPWTAQPTELPAAISRHDPQTGRSTVYVSWNGATGVAAWGVYAGPKMNDLRPFGKAVRWSFETGIQLPAGRGYVAVAALDKSGRELSRSAVIAV